MFTLYQVEKKKKNADLPGSVNTFYVSAGFLSAGLRAPSYFWKARWMVTVLQSVFLCSHSGGV